MGARSAGHAGYCSPSLGSCGTFELQLPAGSALGGPSEMPGSKGLDLRKRALRRCVVASNCGAASGSQQETAAAMRRAFPNL